MKFSGYKKLPPQERKLRSLIDVLCVECGFCISLNDRDRIATTEGWTAEEFAIAVLQAEGMEPEYNVDWLKQIGSLYREKIG